MGIERLNLFSCSICCPYNGLRCVGNPPETEEVVLSHEVFIILDNIVERELSLKAFQVVGFLQLKCKLCNYTKGSQ
jgi:hypothetical protein